MNGCAICGNSSPMLVKDASGKKICANCFVKESPIIDEGWRILKEAMDKNMEWVDMHALARSGASTRKKKSSGGRNADR